MVCFRECRSIRIEGVTLMDPPCYTVWCLGCDLVEIRNLKIRADLKGPNCDGLDIDCCRDVLIENCDIDCGDDCIAIRANEAHACRVAPCERVDVRNCLLRSPACAVRIGVGNGTLRNCTLKELRICDSSVGVGLCPSYTPGQCVDIDNILFENVQFEGEAAFLMVPYWGSTMLEDDPAIKPVRNIILRNFHGECTQNSLVAAPAAKGIWSNILFENVTLKLHPPYGYHYEWRWPFEEQGVLNVLRFPEIEVAGLRCESEDGRQEVVFRG